MSAGEAEEPPQRSPRRGMCSAVLFLEAIAVGLSTPVMITVAGVEASTALSVGLGLAVACLVAAGMLRSERAYLLGYAIQAAAVALGVVVTAMFFLGAVFAALWTTADLLGRRIERERAAAWASWRAQQT